MTSLYRCAQCNEFHAAGQQCPAVETSPAPAPNFRWLAFCLALLGLIVVLFFASGCADMQIPVPTPVASVQATPQPTPMQAVTPQHAPVTSYQEAALPEDELSWSEWALSMNLRWCVIEDGVKMLYGKPDGPRRLTEAEAALIPTCLGE